MDIKNLYRQYFLEDPESIFDCGGRFEILGNHTDHNHGLCLAATANMCITAGVSKRNDKKVLFHSYKFPDVDINLRNLEPNNEENKSAAMIRGVAKYLLDNGYKIGGFNAVSYSTIFQGAGLSSSAAFELLVGEIFNKLFNDGKIPKLVLCKAGQYSENYYYGKKSGLLDQIGVSYGNIVSIDFKNIANPKVKKIGYPFDNLHFVSINTGSNHSSLNSLYSSIPNDMYNAAKKMGHEFLRDCSAKELKINYGLTEMETSRAIHFFTENNRVQKAIKALNEVDQATFLKMINESRISSTNNLKNMMIENHYQDSPLQACDRAMEIMENKGACKINGGGFGGSIICLVPEEYLKVFMKKMSGFYGKENVVEIFVRPYGPRKVC